MNLSSSLRRTPYQPSTELQREITEAWRNQLRLERYRYARQLLPSIANDIALTGALDWPPAKTERAN